MTGTIRADGRTLHQFVNDEGFGIVVPLLPEEVAMPRLVLRLQGLTMLAEYSATLCAYATGFDGIEPARAATIDIALDVATDILGKDAQRAHDASRELLDGGRG